MKALVYHGTRDVRVDEVPDPQLQADTDVILRVTATAICGSDLHLYRGRIPMLKPGDILGHEFMGVVEACGKQVTRLQRGDRVVVPFTISCGECFFCRLSLFSACETSNPDHGAIMNKKSLRPGAGMFGYSHLYGGYAGGQAEYVRVPYADVGPLLIPPGLDDEQVLFLSDILPTGYQAVRNAHVGPVGSLAIFGAGPVGCMAAACARLLGVERIFMVDHHNDRLDHAEAAYGVETINFDEIDDPAAVIVDLTDRRSVDATIDAVGFEAKGSRLETALLNLKLEGSSGHALRQAIAATRRGGTISVPGVYAGFIHGFLFGDAFEKGLQFAMGQTHVQQHMPALLRFIQDGRLDVRELITHRLPLSEAAQGYQRFAEKQEGCRKVVLRPGA